MGLSNEDIQHAIQAGELRDRVCQELRVRVSA
jgi:hypothetical protein